MDLYEMMRSEIVSKLTPIAIALIVSLVCGGIGKSIVRGKGYPDHLNHGFAWGFWLNILGIIVCACKSDYSSGRRNNYNNSGSSYSSTQQNYTPTYTPRYQSYNYSSNSRTITQQNFGAKLNTLSDSGDVRIQSSEQNRRLASDARTYRTHKKQSFSTIKSGETISVDLSWSENLAELLEATEIVYSNAEMNCNRRLLSERFDYYINLHYRSFTAADLCHAKLEEILPHDAKLRKIISRLNDRNDFLRVDKSTYNQLISLRNTTGDICNLLKQRRDRLNQQTGIIRDKIRDECGQRGKDWYARLKERAGK